LPGGALLQPVGAPLELAASGIRQRGETPRRRVVVASGGFLPQATSRQSRAQNGQGGADEMIKLKRTDHLSERYVKQLEYAMNRFTGRFPRTPVRHSRNGCGCLAP